MHYRRNRFSVSAVFFITSMSIPASNTLIYAITGFKPFAEPVKTSAPVLFANDAKGRYSAWLTGQPVGFTTGKVISNSTGTWVELITREWKKRAFDWIRIDRTAWFRVEDGFFYDETGAKAVAETSLKTRLSEAYDSLDKQYHAVETYTNDAGKTMLVFSNGNRVSLEEYEKLSLLEKRNYAIPKAQNGIVSSDPTTPKPETQTNKLPTWAIALLIALGVSGLGLLGYSIFKTSKNGNSKKR